MSFMYKTMMSRAPNKRKIKINEENLLSLMTNSDGEDEEDEDFTISAAKDKKEEAESDADQDSDSSESDESKSDSTSEDQASKQESEDDDQPGCSSQIRKPVRKRKKVVPCPTVKEYNLHVATEYYGAMNSTTEILKQAKKQWAQSENMVNNMKSWPDVICSVCLDEEKNRKWNKLVTCQKCGISVHEGCYQVRPVGIKKKSHDDVWICESCIYGGDDVVCQLCPNLWGCMKETKCGRWVHIVCARNVLSDFLYNSPGTSRKSLNMNTTFYIQLNDQMITSSKHFGQKECVLCEDRLVAKTGICIKCDAGLCKSSFHVTCAQRHGLLAKAQSSGDANNNTSGSTPDSYIANCPLHCNKEEVKKRQRSFILQLKTAELKRKRLERLNQHEQNQVSAKLSSSRAFRLRQRDSFVPPRPPLEQVPRLLSSDAHFTRLLNDKAEKMFGITTKAPALVIPKPTEIRKRHYVAPSLTTDFAAYFMDRQLRIEEEKSTLSTAMKTNADLSKQQEYERLKYNEIRSSLLACKSNRSDLKKEYESLKQTLQRLSDWAASGKAARSESRKRKSTTPVKRKPSRDLSVSPVSPVGSREHIPDAESIIDLKSCGICKGQENQHLLARCDVCRQWQHLGCLDPPLTQMPKRTKFSLWQCSECADSSGSSSSESERDNRGSFTNKDGRRLTRRLRRAPEKLAIGFPDAPPIRRSKGSIGHSKFMNKQQKRLREALNTIARQQELQKRMLAGERTSTPKASRETKTSSEEESSEKKSDVIRKTTDNTNPTTSLRFGVTCDNYLSQAARMPIISQPKPSPPHSTWAQKGMRKIIILKKSVPVPHRPVGLGQSKKQFILLKKPLISKGSLSQRPSEYPPLKSAERVSVEEILPRRPSKDLMSERSQPKLSQETLTADGDQPLKYQEDLSSKRCQPPKPSDSLIPEKQQTQKPPETMTMEQFEVQKSSEPHSPKGRKPEKKAEKVCTICKSTKNDRHVVTCDTCHKDYHWKCCDPPLKSNPVSKFATWECSNCVDKREDEEDKHEPEVDEDRGSSVTAEGRRVINRKRKPPELFEPAFNVSNQQKIFKSIEKQKMRKIESVANRREMSTSSAARCRSLTESGWIRKMKFPPPFQSHMPLQEVLMKSISKINLSGFNRIAIVNKETGSKQKVISLIPCQRSKLATPQTNKLRDPPPNTSSNTTVQKEKVD